jgi:hypothetical protein
MYVVIESGSVGWWMNRLDLGVASKAEDYFEVTSEFLLSEHWQTRLV